MTTTLIIVILAALALLLFAIEGLLMPGFGIFGLGGTACVIAADVLIFYDYGTGPAVVAVLVSAAAVLAFFWWLTRSKTLDRMSLHAEINSSAATNAQLSVSPGEEGVALTRLALIGNAEIGGKVVEVKSESGFLDEGTRVVVTRVSEALIQVRRKD